MRVAFLTHEPFHPPSGGGSAEAAYLVRELVRRGHEVHVFGPQDERPDEVAATFGIRLHRFTRWRMGRYTRLRNVKYLLYPAALARQVASVAERTHFDVLLSQHAIAAVAAGRLRRPLRVPVVMNFLDHLTGFLETWPVWRMPPPLLAVLKRYELSLPRRFDAEAVLTVSETLADRFVTAGYPAGRLRALGYGYDATAFPFRAEAVAARAEGPPRIVMHGSLTIITCNASPWTPCPGCGRSGRTCASSFSATRRRHGARSSVGPAAWGWPTCCIIGGLSLTTRSRAIWPRPRWAWCRTRNRPAPTALLWPRWSSISRWGCPRFALRWTVCGGTSATSRFCGSRGLTGRASETPCWPGCGSHGPTERPLAEPAARRVRERLIGR
ncbi:MAG: glycosyltransferase family 4 protein [Verrucomicrobia bacterium]|nr:glycosyltransferase family 4 protein [Verrucomicrobiota bacterium]